MGVGTCFTEPEPFCFLVQLDEKEWKWALFGRDSPVSKEQNISQNTLLKLKLQRIQQY